MTGYAITAVNKARYAFCKFISANDVGATGAHQAGFYIPKNCWPLMFDAPGIKGTNKDRFIKIRWQNDFETVSRFIYYGSGTRNEYRLTRLGKNFLFFQEDNVGDLIIICQIDSDLRDYVIRQVQQLIKESRSERENRERKPVLEAIAYMKEHFTEKITLEDVAATIGFNTNYFSELFKKETGENFSNYLLGIRMEKAKQMLRDTKIPVYEIGESVGYKDAKYFSQQFMKVVGVKPAEYRKLYY